MGQDATVKTDETLSFFDFRQFCQCRQCPSSILSAFQTLCALTTPQSSRTFSTSWPTAFTADLDARVHKVGSGNLSANWIAASITGKPQIFSRVFAQMSAMSFALPASFHLDSCKLDGSTAWSGSEMVVDIS